MLLLLVVQSDNSHRYRTGSCFRVRDRSEWGVMRVLSSGQRARFPWRRVPGLCWSGTSGREGSGGAPYASGWLGAAEDANARDDLLLAGSGYRLGEPDRDQAGGS